jgi:FixJ family two-component response regulator
MTIRANSNLEMDIVLTLRNLVSVVDDDLSMREAVADLLEAHGFDVASFASAEAFLQSASPRRTACLITDVQMPGMDGLALQQHLIVLEPMIAVIFVTAFPGVQLRRRALRAGALGFLAKPIDQQQLLRHVHLAFQRLT